MTQKILQGALSEWNYCSSETLKAIESVPVEFWNDSPSPGLGSFAKQVRHVICCRGVFTDGFKAGTIDFSMKHSFYSGALNRDELLAAFRESTQKTHATLSQLKNLEDYSSDYYGERLSFIEHFSALVAHEALHRGQWMVYAVLGKYAEGKKS